MATTSCLMLRARRSCLSAAVIVLWSMCGAVAARPQIGVVFDIAAQDFQSLPQRDDAARDIAQRVAKKYAAIYPFADWLPMLITDPALRPAPAASVTPVTPAAASPVGIPAPPPLSGALPGATPVDPANATAPLLGALVLRLEVQPDAPFDSVVVRWAGRFGGHKETTPFAETQIYSPTTTNWATNNRGSFVTQVAGALGKTMNSDSYLRHFAEAFIRHLAIARNVKAVANKRVIVLPLSWDDMLMAPDSEVLMQVEKNVDGARQLGMFTLKNFAPSNVQPDVGRLQGSIDNAVFDSQSLPLTQHWNAQVPLILTGAQVACFISDYRQAVSADTDGVVAISAN